MNPVNYYFMDLSAEDYDRMIQLALKRERTEESLTFTFDTNILNQASFGGSKGSKM